MPEINWTEAWVAVLTAGLALSVYLQHLKNKGIEGRITDLVAGKQNRRRRGLPRPRARRVDTVFHDRDDEGREHWLCVNCGASVPQMGHTVAACEERQAAIAGDDAELEREMKEAAAQTAAEDVAKAGHEVATAGIGERVIADFAAKTDEDIMNLPETETPTPEVQDDTDGQADNFGRPDENPTS